MKLEVDTRELVEYANALSFADEKLKHSVFPQQLLDLTREIRWRSIEKAPELTGRLKNRGFSPVRLNTNTEAMFSVYAHKDRYAYNYAGLVERPPFGFPNRKVRPVKNFSSPFYIARSVMEVLPKYEEKIMNEMNNVLKGE